MTVVTLSATETTILTAGHGNRVRDGSGSLRPVSGIARGKAYRLTIPRLKIGNTGTRIACPVQPPDNLDAHAYNLGIYRMQVLGRDRAILRWLPRRGGAGHHQAWATRGERMPVAVAIGADPALLVAAVTPVPEKISEYIFAGALRGARSSLVPALTVPLLVPANAEIVLEGWIEPNETAPEGPYGDHTGY